MCRLFITTLRMPTASRMRWPWRRRGCPINDQKVTYRRSKTKIPHNKFIVRLDRGTKPIEVWTGSTNFTASGFLGQTNVGHRIKDSVTAEQYFDFWKLVKTDPELDYAPGHVGETHAQSGRSHRSAIGGAVLLATVQGVMLGWYGRRMLDAANCVCFTAAFGVAKVLVQPIAKKRPQMRFVLMEKPVPPAQKKILTADFNRVISLLRRPTRRTLQDQKRQGYVAEANSGIRTRQVVLQGGTLPPS